MSNNPKHQHGLGALLLTGASAAAVLGLFMPGLAWVIGAGVLTSLLMLPIGIRPFLAVCCVTLTHFLAIGPPAPYGHSELPLDYLLGFVLMPLTLAAASLAALFWREPGRG